ncbi:MAG: biosynthetic-type acetolactate synthase large subunit [Clostridia bacterium]|nr:biosynthetic-type acetolactate synthase large subunit [Clostridia bacterium]
MKLSGAQIIVEALIDQGCDTVFGYPGGQVLNIYDELYKNSDRITHVLTAHEQGASHAADGYARATGKVGVVIATSGPGATNLVTGIATAYLDSTPMVAITGNVPVDLIGRDSFQEVDIMGITIPITKHNYIVKDIKDLGPTIREAFEIAKSGRPGPVLIDVPKDVQTASTEWTPQGPSAKRPMAHVRDCDVETAVRLIDNAKRPYIYCGGGVVIAGASEELTALSEKIDAPVGCSMMGLSAIPTEHKNALGMQGMHGLFASTRSLAASDLVIACGVRFSDRATGNKSKFAKDAKVIHIDIEPGEIDKNIEVQLGMVGDIKDALSRIIAAVESKSHPEWREQIDKYKQKTASIDVTPDKMRPYAIIDVINKYTTPEMLIATDVGQHQMWAAQRCRFSRPRTFITSGGLGTMGFGLGAAIGASFGTGQKAVLITGDGSFGMNLNELATAVSTGAPVITVIMNNGVLGMVRQWQTLFYDKHYSNTVLDRKTDFVKLAQAFGADGYRAASVSEFETAFKTALEKGEPAVIDCLIDKDEFVLPMTPPGGSIDDIIVRKKEISLD